MLKSQHSVDFRLQIEDWMQSLQDLGKMNFNKKLKKRKSLPPNILLCLLILVEKLLYLFEKHQQTWAFLTKVFHESFCVQSVALVCLCHHKSKIFFFFFFYDTDKFQSFFDMPVFCSSHSWNNSNQLTSHLRN